MTLLLFLDYLSQPARSVYIFLKLNNIDFQPVIVNLREGQHLSEEFKSDYSRLQKIPFIHDGNFRLNESIAIIRYLSSKHNLDNQWYPKDLIKRAKIDEYLEWQHHNTRLFCANYYMKKWIYPNLLGKEARPKELESILRNLNKNMDQIEEIWLKDSEYLTGNICTIADVFAVSEIEQTRAAGFDPTENRPKLGAWLEKVREQTQPHYDDAFQLLKTMKSKL